MAYNSSKKSKNKKNPVKNMKNNKQKTKKNKKSKKNNKKYLLKGGNPIQLDDWEYGVVTDNKYNY